MSVKCPFRKIIYKETSCKGADYMNEQWVQTEEFEDCIGIKCAAYYEETVIDSSCYQSPVRKWRCNLCKGNFNKIN